MGIDEYMNRTRKQHFVSQAEQSLNSCSPDPHSKKAEIYRFDVVDRDPPRIRLKGKNAISRNLSFLDLFTLTRTGKTERVNFERLFHKYEADYPKNVATLASLIDRARRSVASQKSSIDLRLLEGGDFRTLTNCIKYIYTYKLMNWLRSPFKIRDVLRIFAPYLNHSIAEPSALALYIALTDKNDAEEQYICNTYGISPAEYKKWIRLLLLFLYTQDGRSSILEGYVEEFLVAEEFLTTIFIHVSDEHCALLPDTGIIIDSVDEPYATVAFINVSKECMITLQHTFVGKHVDRIVPQNEPPEAARDKRMRELQMKVACKLFINDEAMLTGYNKICVKGAEAQVFSASPQVLGVEVVDGI